MTVEYSGGVFIYSQRKSRKNSYHNVCPCITPTTKITHLGTSEHLCSMVFQDLLDLGDLKYQFLNFEFLGKLV